jgi:O-antigen/teichoic acid export membrane protein
MVAIPSILPAELGHAGVDPDARPRGAFARLRARLPRDGLNGAGVLAVRLGGAALAYAAQVIAARYLGQDGFGIYALALVWLTLLGHLSTFGTNQAVTRHVAQALATGDVGEVRGFLVFGLAFVAAAGLAVGGIAAALLVLAPGLVEAAHVWPLALAVLATPLLALQDNLESFARAFDRPMAGIAPPYLIRHGAAIAIFGALATSGLVPSPALAVGAALAALGISLAVQAALLVRIVGGRVPAGPRRYRVRAWMRTALPVALVDGTEILLLNADVLLVGLFQPPHMVAAYFAASRLAQILDYVRYAASAATAQRFAALEALGRRAELQRLVGYATNATSAVTLLAALALVAAGEPLLRLFGPDFTVAAPILPILAGGILAACLFGPGEDILSMLGAERACAAVFAAALGLNLALGFALIPAFGLTGAALATALTLVARSVALAWIAYRRLGLVLPFGFAWAARHGG